MGWFLSGKSGQTKRKTRKTAKTAKPVKGWDPRRTLAALQMLALMALVLGGWAGWRKAEASLTGYVKEHQTRNIGIKDVVLADKPRWLSAKLSQDLAAIIAAHVTGDPLDHASLEKAAMALNSNPWVRRVARVQRFTDGKIHVWAQYREPIAMVETDDGCRLVDAEGVRLPGLYKTGQAQQIGLPTIVGVSGPPQREGYLWPGDDLKAGLSLVQLLQGEPYLSQIRAFDVSGRDQRGRIRLVLKTRNGMVRWGLPPGQEKPIEPEAETKKEWLTTVYKRQGLIDAGGKTVDVYGAAVFIHQPEGEEPDISVGYHW